MSYSVIAFASGSALFLTGAAHATSLAAIPPHDRAKACQAIEVAVEEMTGKKAQSNLFPLYFSDDFGHVEYPIGRRRTVRL